MSDRVAMSADQPDQPRLSGHALGKSRRRKAIVDAAHNIIATEGDSALTMRRLAAEAGTSVPTAYNLFGSKEAVVRAVMDEDRDGFDAAYQHAASLHPMERIFAVIDLRFEAYRARPTFYRSLLRSLYLARESESDQGIWITYTAYGRTLVDDTVDAGCIDPAHRPFLGRSLIRIYHSAVAEWVSGEIPIEVAHRDVGLSVAILLGDLAEAGDRARIAAIRRRYESPGSSSHVG